MRNILRIQKNDIRRICSSVVGIVFVMGLCLIPCLYAWFNIFSNWDPYGPSATSRIRVAVYSQDKGADILGVELNIGDTIKEALESNDQIGWVFAESKEEALWRVYSSDCYAALVVPQDFSKDFVSFLSLKFEHPELQYYENGKKNAIAPKITGQAKNSVQNQVNATVLKTLVSTAAKVVVALEANGLDIEELLYNLSDKLLELDEKLGEANQALDNVVNVTNGAQSLLLASSTLVSDMSTTIGYTGDLAKVIAGHTADMDASVEDAVNQINQMIQKTSGNISSFYSELQSALADPLGFNSFLENFRDARVEALNNMQARAYEMQSIANTAGLSGLAKLMGDLAGQLGELSSILSSLNPIDPLDEAAWTDVQTLLGSALERLASINKVLSNVILEVAETLGIRIQDAFSGLNTAAQDASALLDELRARTAHAANSLASMAGSMAELQSKVLSAKDGINEARLKLREISQFLDALAGSEFLKEVLDLLRSGPDVLDAHVASPIKVSEEILFPVDGYGSQMSPFYTVLSQWVSALFCAVLFKTRMREEDKLPNMRMYQHFFGRYGIFFLVCVAQALITALGDLLYVNIVCLHPVYFVLAAVMTGICFSMINYMLSFCLGAAGLAVSVIVMVLQVGGSGGTYPVEVLPKIFQVLYPFMPYKFAMNAMREAIFGFYGNYYLFNMGMLALIALGCVGLGFALYVPGKWLNGLLENAKAKSGIMI